MWHRTFRTRNLFVKRVKPFWVGAIYLGVSSKIFKIEEESWRSLEVLEIFKLFQDLQRQFKMGSIWYIYWNNGQIIGLFYSVEGSFCDTRSLLRFVKTLMDFVFGERRSGSLGCCHFQKGHKHEKSQLRRERGRLGGEVSERGHTQGRSVATAEPRFVSVIHYS